ncbi:MAG: hypothetical protein NTU98_08235 [Bacteroidetes bacterium]|nr:hypothetical protein [Bacteroidota bacterium]
MSIFFKIILFFFLISTFSCSPPQVKNQDQLEKERIYKNHIKVRKMYSLEYSDGRPIDSVTKLISEFYYDPMGNEKCVYNCENNQHELRKICEYDKNDNKVLEIWLGIKELVKWDYYKVLYTYDSLNRRESMRLFNTIGELYFGQIYRYDYQGRRVCEIFVDSDTICREGDSLFYRFESRDVFEKRSYSGGDSDSLKLESRILYDYDKNRNLIEGKSFNSNDELVARTTYNYDSHGLKEKETIWDTKKNQPKTIYTYKYLRYKVF